MLPVLQGEEAMRWATAIAVGTGSLKKEESQRIMREWRQGSHPQRAQQPKTMNEHMAMVASFGITTVMITDSGEKAPVTSGPESPDMPTANPEDINITSSGFPASG